MSKEQDRRSTPPVLVDEYDRILDQITSMGLWAASDQALAAWLQHETDRAADVRNYDGRRWRSSPPGNYGTILAKPDSHVTIAFDGEDDGCSVSGHLAVGDRRASGLRSVGGDRYHREAGASRPNFAALSAWFDSVVERLEPSYAYLTYGGGPEAFYDSRYTPPRPVPIGGYHWRNYLTEHAMDGRRLGDGSSVGDGRFIDLGPFPLAPLSVRDHVHAQIAPLLPPRRPVAPALTENGAWRLQTASIDLGLELPEALVAIL